MSKHRLSAEHQSGTRRATVAAIAHRIEPEYLKTTPMTIVLDRPPDTWIHPDTWALQHAGTVATR